MGWLGGGKAPKTPDYVGAAKATSQGNLEAAQYATNANRVNQYTPYGSQTYERPSDPKDPYGVWSQRVNLTPDGQRLLDQDNKTASGLASLQDNATARVAQGQHTPFDFNSVQDVQNQAYKGFTSRLDPQWDQRGKAMDTQLANQGIAQGSEAYSNAQRDFHQGRNDAYQQANIGAINTAPQTFQMANALRSQPLNELNAIRTGAQVTNPTFNNVPQQATTAGADLLGATTAKYQGDMGAYNAQQASGSGMMSGLLGIGGAILGGPAGSFGAQLGGKLLSSDRRLKSSIRPLKQFGGHNWYSYIKNGKPEIGVMAQEIMLTHPAAVVQHPSGYLMVDYGAI